MAVSPPEYAVRAPEAATTRWQGRTTHKGVPLAVTKGLATEDSGRDLADVVLVGAAVASLIAVGVVLFGAGHANGSPKYLQAGFALASVSVSWTLGHTVFTLRYARLYYSGRARDRLQRSRPPRSTATSPTCPSRSA